MKDFQLPYSFKKSQFLKSMILQLRFLWYTKVLIIENQFEFNREIVLHTLSIWKVSDDNIRYDFAFILTRGSYVFIYSRARAIYWSIPL